MVRTEALCRFLGWQGGTVHQVSREIGVSVHSIIYDNCDLLNDDYLAGWNAGNEESRKVTNKGNVQFWLGVADGWKFKNRS